MKKGLMIFMMFLITTIITSCGSNENSLKLANKSSEIAILGDDTLNKNEIIDKVNKLLVDYDSKDLVVRVMIDTSKVSENYNEVSLNLNYQDNVPDNAESIANKLFFKFERIVNNYVENPVVSVKIRDSKNEKDIYICDNKNAVETKIEEEEDKKQNPIKVTSIDFSNYSGDYVDVNVKILNQSGLDINYVKLNLYYHDAKDNVFRSEWTNDDAVIKNGATQIITKMTKNDFESVSVEVDEVSFK